MMNQKQLLELIIEYAKEIISGDNESPDVGMGIGPRSAVKESVKLIHEEAIRWGASAEISQELVEKAVNYLSKTDGKIPLQESFDGWKKLGFHVIKGQKAKTFDNAGIALFSYNQVAKNVQKPHNYASDWDDDFSYSTPSYREPESETVYFADGSGYLKCGGPCGNLYFDRNGNT